MEVKVQVRILWRNLLFPFFHLCFMKTFTNLNPLHLYFIKTLYSPGFLSCPLSIPLTPPPTLIHPPSILQSFNPPPSGGPWNIFLHVIQQSRTNSTLFSVIELRFIDIKYPLPHHQFPSSSPTLFQPSLPLPSSILFKKTSTCIQHIFKNQQNLIILIY